MTDGKAVPLVDLTVAVTGSVAGAFFGGLVSLICIGLSNRSKNLNCIRDSIKKVKQLSTVYWEHSERLVDFEIQIKLALEDLDSDINRVLFMRSKRTCLEKALDSLTTLCTGEKFETAGREPDAQRASDIRICSKKLINLI